MVPLILRIIKRNTMPTFTVRKPGEVPQNTCVSKATRELQFAYESYLTSVGDQVGELELDPSENIRSIKVRLTRAASRLGVSIQAWDANGKVYFQKEAQRGRPRKPKTA
jgi:hypothetical protein